MLVGADMHWPGGGKENGGGSSGSGKGWGGGVTERTKSKTPGTVH